MHQYVGQRIAWPVRRQTASVIGETAQIGGDLGRWALRLKPRKLSNCAGGATATPDGPS